MAYPKMTLWIKIVQLFEEFLLLRGTIRGLTLVSCVHQHESQRGAKSMFDHERAHMGLNPAKSSASGLSAVEARLAPGVAILVIGALSLGSWALLVVAVKTVVSVF